MLDGMKIGDSKLVVANKDHIIKELIKNLPKSWEEHRSENDWGSGEDRISPHHFDKIEEEYYSDQCFEEKLNDDETTKVMHGLGYTHWKP